MAVDKSCTTPGVYMKSTVDIAIIGGGVIGSSVAYWLSISAPKSTRILVIERDPSYAFSSTALSAASIRMQFSNPINVAISKFGVAFIRDFQNIYGPENGPFDLGLKEDGYLFLAGTPAQSAILRQNNAIQRGQGADVSLLAPDDLQKRYPFLHIQDISLASLGMRGEGWFDNMGLLNGLKEINKRHNVSYLHDEVNAIKRSGQNVISLKLTSGDTLNVGQVVNAAGPRANRIARMAGLDIPVEPRKRTTFILQCPTPPPANTPLIVDYTGVYVKPEGDFWMAATQPIDDLAVAFDDFEPRYQEFEEIIWPKLAARAKMFEELRVKRIWAGHYAYNTLDQNAIIGRHPELDNLYFANGFSGHGLQQAPAIGRGLAELMLTGSFQSLDLGQLGLDRILRGEPFLEHNVV